MECITVDAIMRANVAAMRMVFSGKKMFSVAETMVGTMKKTVPMIEKIF
jgi:hypothetical protein